jgi:arylsulfatase
VKRLIATVSRRLVSMAYGFNDAAAPDRRETQYFEMLGNRGIYHKGWTAVTAHDPPGARGARRLEDDVWELYDTDSDWTQAHDLAKQRPDKERLKAALVKE